MKQLTGVLALLGAVLSAACAVQQAGEQARSTCGAKGRTAFLVEARQGGLGDAGHARFLCVSPNTITHLSSFGADVIWTDDIDGVGVVSVSPGSVAARAGIQPNDVVQGFAGRHVAGAAELQAAIVQVPPGGQTVIQVRRNGRDTALTAHF
jgi:S1-C subfamily serine protease